MISPATHADLSIAMLETKAMQSLAKVKAGNTIQPFTTDGCSGGLSAAWSQMARHIPAFANKFGDRPVYHHCCVEHDKAYWQGETKDGARLRLLADEQLKQCVIDVGRQQRASLAREFNLAPTTIDQSFRLTANFMFQVVRLGGAACNFMPWRWGYGWPQCYIHAD